AQLALGGEIAAVLSTSLTRAGYELNLQGEADAQRLQDFLFTLGLPPAPGLNRTQLSQSNFVFSPATIEASVVRERVNLQVNGWWSGFSPPIMAGTVHPEAA